MQHCKTWLRSLQPHVLSNVHIETDTRDLRRALKKRTGGGRGGGKALTIYLYHSTKQPNPTRNFSSYKLECKKGIHIGDASFDQ